MRQVIHPDFVGSVESRSMHNVGQKIINLTVGGHGHRVRSAQILECVGIRTFVSSNVRNGILQCTSSIAIESKRVAGLGGEVGEESRCCNADGLMAFTVGPNMIFENKNLVVNGIPVSKSRIDTSINLFKNLLSFLDKGEIRF